MARILYELFLIGQPPHDEFHAPRSGPSTWVLDCEPIKKVVFIEPLPPFGQMRLFGGAIGIERTHAPILEVGVFDDERIALPVPARRSLVETKALRRTRTPIQIDHLRFMGFRTDDHHVPALNNLQRAYLTSGT